jgi:hypothetical protein
MAWSYRPFSTKLLCVLQESLLFLLGGRDRNRQCNRWCLFRHGSGRFLGMIQRDGLHGFVGRIQFEDGLPNLAGFLQQVFINVHRQDAQVCLHGIRVLVELQMTEGQVLESPDMRFLFLKETSETVEAFAESFLIEMNDTEMVVSFHIPQVDSTLRRLARVLQVVAADVDFHQSAEVLHRLDGFMGGNEELGELCRGLPH